VDAIFIVIARFGNASEIHASLMDKHLRRI
jgi:hypothetical protein